METNSLIYTKLNYKYYIVFTTEYKSKEIYGSF